MTEPPYQRIAAELRARIRAGELKPGDHIPSARQITRDWNVAIATATKVLAVLRQDGLVEAVPGIGTVVSTAMVSSTVDRPVPTQEPTDLSRAQIVAAAIELADTEGIAALSMRRVAASLGVPTMSLYRHVGSKDELVLEMIDRAIGELPLPADPPDGWRVRFELAARLQWRGFRRHHWLGPAMSVTRPQLVPNALRFAEWSMSALAGLGLDANAQIHIHVTVFSFVRGLATSLEPEAEAERDTGMTSDEWMDFRESSLLALAGSGSFGNFLQLAQTSPMEVDLDTIFEFGLARMLDGLGVFIAQGRPLADDA